MPDLLQLVVNYRMPMTALAFDDTRVSVTGTSETEVKYFRFSVFPQSKYTTCFVRVSLWVNGGTGTLNIYIDNEATPRLTFSTNLATEQIFEQSFYIGDLSSGLHTFRVKMKNSGSYTTYSELLEVFAR